MGGRGTERIGGKGCDRLETQAFKAVRVDERHIEAPLRANVLFFDRKPGAKDAWTKAVWSTTCGPTGTSR